MEARDGRRSRKARLGDIIDWADANALDLIRSRDLEREVVDMLDAD